MVKYEAGRRGEGLFSDAEFRKNRIKNIFRRGDTDDIAQVVQGGLYFHGKQIRRG